MHVRDSLTRMAHGVEMAVRARYGANVCDAAHNAVCSAQLYSQVAVTQQMQGRVRCPHTALAGCHWRALNDNRQSGLVLRVGSCKSATS